MRVRLGHGHRAHLRDVASLPRITNPARRIPAVVRSSNGANTGGVARGPHPRPGEAHQVEILDPDRHAVERRQRRARAHEGVLGARVHEGAAVEAGHEGVDPMVEALDAIEVEPHQLFAGEGPGPDEGGLLEGGRREDFVPAHGAAYPGRASAPS